ncbi:MAG: M48 family metalloprotease [Spirosomataceae bacterium]
MKNIKLFTLSTVLSTFVFSTNAQNNKPYYACNYYGKQVNEKAICNMMGFSSRKEADKAVEEIVRRSGLKKNFYVMECPNTDNCFAAVQNGNRLIVYDGAFMRRVNNMTQTKDWGALSILAHEIGHHLQGHTIIEGGSDPAKEIEADEFSGFVMYQMGASLKEAQAAIQKLTTDYDGGTHPPRGKRLAAIEKGYRNAMELYPNINKNANDLPAKTTPEEKVETPKTEPRPQQQPPRQTKPNEVEVVVDKVERPVENRRPPEVGSPDSPMNNNPEVPKVDPNSGDNGNGNVKKTGCVDGDCMNGAGTAINSKTDEKYVGEWRNGKREGWGTEFNVDNSKKYEGNFKNNRYNGNGTLFFKNGERYVGKFKDGIMHGEGYYAYKNGDKLMATWVNGKKQGKAKIIYRSGNEGTKFFKDDVELR